MRSTERLVIPSAFFARGICFSRRPPQPIPPPRFARCRNDKRKRVRVGRGFRRSAARNLLSLEGQDNRFLVAALLGMTKPKAYFAVACSFSLAAKSTRF